MHRRRALAVAIVIAVAISAVVSFTQDVGLDYGGIDCHVRDPYCDDAQPALDALIHGRVAEFFHRQPLMGPVTLVLRAPFAALAGLNGYDPKLVYDLGVLACMLALAAAAVALVCVMRSRGQPLWLQAVAGLGMLANPIVFKAIQAGHPEELVVTAACIGAGLAVLTQRETTAGFALALGVAAKLWALLVAPAIVLAVRHSPWRIILVAAAVTLALYAPMVIGDPGRFRGALSAANDLGTLPGSVTPANVWWFVARENVPFDRNVAVDNGRLVTKREVGYVIKDNVAGITHPLVVALAWLLALLWARGPRARAPETLLLLFSLVFLLRCILDPGNFGYYHLPAVLSLLAFEAIAFRRPPWAAAWLTFAVWGTSELAPHIRTDPAFGHLYLGWAIPTAAALAAWLFVPRLAPRSALKPA